MAKEAFDKIMAGLDDARAYAKGDTSRGRAHEIPVRTTDVKVIREKLGLSQARFSQVFRISIGTLQGWEQHRRIPDGPALTLLEIIDKEPALVLRTLQKVEAS
jgi:putative transcriptional regulator